MPGTVPGFWECRVTKSESLQRLEGTDMNKNHHRVNSATVGLEEIRMGVYE